MTWLDIDFAKCDKTENKNLIVELKPHWSPAVSREAYDVKLPFCPNVNEIIFSKEGTNDQLMTYNSQQFYFTKHVFIKQIYLDLETLFAADNIAFDFPFNEDIIMHYQTNVVLVSPIAHKEFRVLVLFDAMIPLISFQTYIGYILYLCKHQNPFFKAIKMNPCGPLSHEVEAIVKIQSEILSNFSKEEIKAMDMETSPLYLPIAFEFMHNHFESFIQLIRLTNNKEILNSILSDERSAHELSGEAKAIIIKRMAELDDERSFEI